MIRFIGAGLIIAASAAAGAYLNARLQKRVKYLDGFAAALEYLKAHICFSDFEMEKALRLANDVCDTGGVFCAAAENMKADGLKKAWKRAVYINADKMCLKTADANAIASLGERLGLTDAEDQKKNIENVLVSLAVCRAEAKAEYEKNGRLYRSCSVMCGALAALLLI